MVDPNDMDPEVIDPPDFDQKAAWGEHKDALDNVQREDGSTNWRAAFNADPGCVGCPNCDHTYWCLGRRQRCRECGFEFETDWWPMYSWGVQAKWTILGVTSANARMVAFAKEQNDKYKDHPYWQYGFKNPPPKGVDLYEFATKKVKWKKVLSHG